MAQLINSLLKDRRQGMVVDEPAAESSKSPTLNSEVDHSLRYFFIFVALGGGCAVWLSKLIANFNIAPAGSSFWNLVLAISLFLIVMLFQSVMIKSFVFNFLLVIVEALALAAFFYNPFTAWIAIAIGLFVVGWFSGFSRARTHLENAVHVHFMHYATSLASVAITSLALFLATFYGGLYQQNGGITFTAYKFVVSSATPGVQYVAPNFNPETKVSSFLETTIKDYLGSHGEFTSLPNANQRAVVEQASSGIMDQLTSITKIALQPGDSIVSYTFRWLSDLAKTLQERGLGVFVVAGIFISIFFSIKSFMFFLKWPILGIAMMIYLLLQAVGVITIGSETRQKEVIIVK